MTTPLTFCATVNSILHAGGIPVLADVDAKTMNLDPEEVRRKMGSRVRAILPVHFAGRACDMDALLAIAAEWGAAVIEDCTHAIETEYKGRKAGTLGTFGCFSFYSTKNVVTGEGGMVLARDAEQADQIRILGLYGMSRDAWKRFSDQGFKHYDVVEAGFKYNMMDLQAAIGIHQLARVESGWKRREEIWNGYQEAFAELPIGLPAPVEPETRHAYHLYTIQVDESRSRSTRTTSAPKDGGLPITPAPRHRTADGEPPSLPKTHRFGPRGCNLGGAPDRPMIGTRGGEIDNSPRKSRSRTCDLPGRRLGRRTSTASTSARHPGARVVGGLGASLGIEGRWLRWWKASAEVVWGS